VPDKRDEPHEQPDGATTPVDAPDDSVAPRRPANAAAAAASRARRIGGRTTSRTGTDDPASDPATTASPAPDRAGKTGGTGAAGKAAAPDPSSIVVALPGWLRWLPAGVLTAGAIAMAIVLVIAGHGVWWSKPSPASVRDRVLAAAKTCTTTINTYKYTDLKAYETKALACTTGTLTSDLRSAIDTIVKVKAPQLKASQTVQINNAGIETASGGGRQWTVLVFGQLHLVSSDYPKGTDSPFAAEVQLEKRGGVWRLSVENTLGGSSGGSGTGTTAPSGSPTAPTGSPTGSPTGGPTGSPTTGAPSAPGK
jgi:hypothetical protein